jgi:hypothetical protein
MDRGIAYSLEIHGRELRSPLTLSIVGEADVQEPLLTAGDNNRTGRSATATISRMSVPPKETDGYKLEGRMSLQGRIRPNRKSQSGR